MNKGNNNNKNFTSLKKKVKNNILFEIVKIKRTKNRKNSVETENIILTYNLHEKKNTTLKKIFNYHEISDKIILNNEENPISKNRNLLEKNYSIKCIFLDRHVKSYFKSDKYYDLTLDLLEKEEKSKIIDMILIKSDLISDDYKINNINLLKKKTYSNNNLICKNLNRNLNSGSNLNIVNSINANCCTPSNNTNMSLCSNNDANNCNLIDQNQDIKNNFLNVSDRKIFKQKFLYDIRSYLNSSSLIPVISSNFKNHLQTISNNDNSNLSSENIKNPTTTNNVNSNTSQNHFKEKQEFKNYFMHFVKYFPQDFDCFEYEVIKLLSSKMSFPDFSNIFLFLYDDLKKLRDQKTIDLLKNKVKENINEDLTVLRMELKNFYEYRSNIINEFLGKEIVSNEWNEDRVFNEILLTSLIAEKLKNTNELDLTQNYIMGKNIQMIMSAMKFNNFIWKIVLNSNKIGEEGMFLLGRILHYNHKIIDLDISLNFLTDKAIGLFIKGIDNSFVNLQRLNLSNNNGLTYLSGDRLKEIIFLSPNLKTLNISRINLEKGILRVLEGLLLNQNLEELICIYTQISDDILIEIANFFTQYNELIKLKKLNLSDNKFSANGPKEFFNSLCCNNTLKELIMYNCKMENQVFENFCKMIKSNTCLEKVNFYNNDFNSMDNIKKLLKIKKLNYFVKGINTFNNINNFVDFENIKSGKLNYLLKGGLINKSNIEKQVSFLDMNKNEECTLQDNHTKSNIGNSTSLCIPMNNLESNKECK